jgi:adenylate/nucleoside-diphosphate kinase
MRTPWLFENLNLPEKLPPPIKPIDVSSLPIIGYLEQTVSRILTESLTSVGNFRPKHPFKSSARSACEYVGLFLKGKVN